MTPVLSRSDQFRRIPARFARGGAGALARAFLVLSGCSGAALLVVAAIVGANLESPEAIVVLAAAASGAAALGLFMTWGDPGSRTGNAAKALSVLFLLVGGATALLVWAGRTAGSGS
jgi:protein-S-isoprenylcysteine O-methyltransferase Ste14